MLFEKSPKSRACWCIQADKRYCLMSLLWRCLCIVWVNQTANLTINLANWPVQPFLYSFINIRLKYSCKFIILVRTAVLDTQPVTLCWLGWLVQWSVTQDDVILIVTSPVRPVRYLVFYNLCYEPWNQLCIKWFGSKAANIVFTFGSNSKFWYILTRRIAPLESGNRNCPANLVSHKIAPTTRKIAS